MSAYHIAMSKILFVTSEIYPLIKTGGLADVSASLPRALQKLGAEVRIVMPAYHDALLKTTSRTSISRFNLEGNKVSIIESRLASSEVKIWLIDYPQYFERPGNPYLSQEGIQWTDNAHRFSFFAKAVVEIAMGRVGLGWTPNIVHCNDWQSGLAPALLSFEIRPPATVFTIHNLAYQGLFGYSVFKQLNLPPQFWHYKALEFHNQVSFIKGGLVYADRCNTVSPTYAQEIQSSEFGFGLESLLTYRKDRLNGILNGIDTETWNPKTDKYIPQNFNSTTLPTKVANKSALQQELNLPRSTNDPLLASIGRLVPQKGIDLLFEALPQLVKMPLQIVFLGSGEKKYERSLSNWARKYPKRICFRQGYDETLSHRIEAGADIFLMPSLFEPCGLNQMYSQRYGTVPIVRRVGGLADTVIDTNKKTIASGKATGIIFELPTGNALLHAVSQAVKLYQNKKYWEQIQLAGMQRDFSWRKSAKQYSKIYELALEDAVRKIRFKSKFINAQTAAHTKTKSGYR